MDKLTNETLDKIEQALGYKLHDWQRDFLQGKGVLYFDIRNGKLMVAILRLLFENDVPMSITDFYIHSPSVITATKACDKNVWIINTVKEIYTKLNDSGIKTREVIF